MQDARWFGVCWSSPPANSSDLPSLGDSYQQRKGRCLRLLLLWLRLLRGRARRRRSLGLKLHLIRSGGEGPVQRPELVPTSSALGAAVSTGGIGARRGRRVDAFGSIGAGRGRRVDASGRVGVGRRRWMEDSGVESREEELDEPPNAALNAPPETQQALGHEASLDAPPEMKQALGHDGQPNSRRDHQLGVTRRGRSELLHQRRSGRCRTLRRLVRGPVRHPLLELLLRHRAVPRLVLGRFLARLSAASMGRGGSRGSAAMAVWVL
ncbi:hypothetical protein EJB05_35466 [Eragrostis curvula]|uniref:Uncharacterized protein n=1 Tax=Eragrostis curvula TaxID=38414 RepID=A0A5J9U6J1_9POAL|nr:hypothetical protein EJB05_35466 [Eragrostis curvula]